MNKKEKAIYMEEYKRLRKLNGGKPLGRVRMAQNNEAKGLTEEEFSRHRMCERCNEIGCVKDKSYCSSCLIWLQAYA